VAFIVNAMVYCKVAIKADETPPDRIVQPGVPQGKVTVGVFEDSKIFPGTRRDFSVYVPAQYKGDQPAALMVFQDGDGMKNVNGRWRVPVVFDNLIARGDMPPTIAVFINPGHDKSKPRQNGKHSNRSFEYDSLGDRYVHFLTEEIIPEVRRRYTIPDDPEMHAIGGSSSGAISAFTAAWERTNFFRKVYSRVGSFTNLRGGNVYPAPVRKTEPKPIRMYMADTSGDVDNAFGSWWWANQRMATAWPWTRSVVTTLPAISASRSSTRLVVRAACYQKSMPTSRSPPAYWPEAITARCTSRMERRSIAES